MKEVNTIFRLFLHRSQWYWFPQFHPPSRTNQDEECLVGHVPMEISSLLYHFLQEDKSNSIKVKVIGKRKREIGLPIPATFKPHTENKRTAEIFNTELAKWRKMFTTFELKHEPKRFFREFPVFELKLYNS